MVPHDTNPTRLLIDEVVHQRKPRSPSAQLWLAVQQTAHPVTPRVLSVIDHGSMQVRDYHAHREKLFIGRRAVLLSHRLADQLSSRVIRLPMVVIGLGGPGGEARG